MPEAPHVLVRDSTSSSNAALEAEGGHDDASAATALTFQAKQSGGAVSSRIAWRSWAGAWNIVANAGNEKKSDLLFLMLSSTAL